MAAKRRKKASKSKNVKAAGRVTRSSITFKLTPEEVKKAQACLEKSGEIRYTFNKISVTKLPQLLDDGKIID